ncbi:uncharacterized protein LOC124666533 [Lolium rigidum]|uniref:uncharacterized protein LOC124666533 n=1 Tax=Lolium rigidum TaxID=89674 RepID=UPI001F5D5BB9|nr:uncharacterized protein LOC124666533 [Lolium rigidum]
MMPRPRKRNRVAEEDAGDKPVYLVVEHEVKEPSHSIVIAAGTTTPPVMVPLRYAKRGMSFAAVDSRWIVGVGGDYRCPFSIYDLTTSKESGGPRLLNNKVYPILIPHRGMLYILSSRPKVDMGADFLPWFEMISFRNGSLPQSGGCASYDLPPPPIFPYCINPLEYLNPPDVRVAAYAVVDSHILISVSYQQQQQQQQHEEKGTCAFDMDKRVWDMVHDKSLPFVGQAIPLGDSLFVARSKDSAGTAALYTMYLFPAKDTSTGKKELSIVKLKLDPHIVLGQHLCAPGMDGFSSFHVPSRNRSPDAVLEKARVIQHTYSLVKGGDIDLELVKKQAFQLLDPSSLFARPAPLVAAFTMDSE